MNQNLEYLYWDSPVGIVELSASLFGLKSLRIVIEARDTASTTNIHLLNAVTQLREYFNGNRENFEILLDLEQYSAFERNVWSELDEVPYGTTITYSDLAGRINKPRAARAVGKANGDNPIAIIIPCHRLIGKDGKLRGYAYGLDVKAKLIKHERHFRLMKQGLGKDES